MHEYMKEFCGCIFRELGWEGVGFGSSNVAEMLASYLYTPFTYLMCFRP